MIKLTPRLQTLYDLTPHCCSAVDVGCDHGYLICRLLADGVIQKGYASDISAPSLQKAIDFAAAQGLAITAVCTDGLKDVPETDTVLIAGMGGILISEILKSCSWVKQPGKTLVLQPMSHPHVLRNFLYQNGFEITKEVAVTEGRRSYTVMLCTFTGGKKTITEFESYIGGLKGQNDPAKIAYVNKILYQLQKQREGLSLQGEDTARIDALITGLLAESGE